MKNALIVFGVVIAGAGYAIAQQSQPDNADEPNTETGDEDLHYDDKIELLAQAIAHAEGYYAPARNGIVPLPRRIFNPVDLTKDLVGKATGFEQGKAVFANEADGFANAYRQLEIIKNGSSRKYQLEMSMQDFAVEWTGADAWQSWLRTVTQLTDTNANTTLGEYFNG